MTKYAKCAVCGYAIAIPDDKNSSDYVCPNDGNTLTDATKSEYDESTHIKGPYSAIVYKDGSSVYAEDANGTTIAEGEAGVDDASVIQSAIDIGGKIVLDEETFIVSTPISITRDNVTLEGHGWSSTIKVADGISESNYGAIRITGEETGHLKNIILRNFQVDGNRDNQGAYETTPSAIDAVHVDYLLCENLYIHHSMGDGISDSGYYHWFINNHICNGREHEIHLNGVDYAWVIGNYLHDDDKAVLILAHGGANHALIKGNILENAGVGCGLIVLAEDTSRKNDITIEGNILKDSGGSLIEVWTNYTGLKIINNYITGTNSYAILMKSDGAIIRGNQIRSTPRGISVSSNNCIVSNNYLEDVKDYPMRLLGEQNLAVGNILESCGGYSGHYPVYIGGSYNIFEHNIIGPLHENWVDAISVTGDHHIIRHNDLTHASKKTIIISATDTIIKENKGFRTDTFKATSQSVEVGISDSYGSAINITSPSGMVSSLSVCKIVLDGSFAGGEQVTVKVETNWESGNTAYVEKTYTATGTNYLDLDGQDGLDLWRDSDTCTSIKLYAKSDQTSTSVTVTCDLAGTG